MCANITYKTYTLQVKNRPLKNVSPDEKKIRPSFCKHPIWCDQES